MSEFAAEVSRQVGREIYYNNLSPAEYATVLMGFGLPQMMVDVVVDADTKSVTGALDSSSKDLRNLLHRPTTTLSEAISAALKILSASDTVTLSSQGMEIALRRG